MKMAYPKCVLFGALQFKNKSFRRMPHVYGVTALQCQLNLGGETDGGGFIVFFSMPLGFSMTVLLCSAMAIFVGKVYLLASKYK